MSICFATSLQNKLNSDIVHFITHLKEPCSLICCKTGWNIAGKMRNIAIQLVWQQCCKTSWTFLVACFAVALTKDILQWCTPTGSRAILICLDSTKFVLESVFTVIETIFPRMQHSDIRTHDFGALASENITDVFAGYRGSSWSSSYLFYA